MPILAPSGTEPGIKATFSPDDLLTLLNDELHGKKNAFNEGQKLRHINKAIDELWKIFRNLHASYFSSSAVLNLVATTNQYALPPDFAEVIFWEVTSPSDYAGLEFVYQPINSPIFRSERQTDNAFPAVSIDSLAVIPGQLNYTILGPGPETSFEAAQILLARRVPVNLTVTLWYIRGLGWFSIPKNTTEILMAFPQQYIWNLIVYAAKSLIKSEDNDPSEFEKWESEWRTSIERATVVAAPRQSSDADVVEGFVEL